MNDKKTIFARVVKYLWVHLWFTVFAFFFAGASLACLIGQGKEKADKFLE